MAGGVGQFTGQAGAVCALGLCLFLAGGFAGAGQFIGQVGAVFALGLCLFLAGVFAGAALHKGRDYPGFIRVLAGYRLLPLGLLPFAAPLVIAAEALAALGLALRVGGLEYAAPALLLAYALAMEVNLLRGRTNLDCGCGASDQPISQGLVCRNLLLAGLLAIFLPQANLSLLGTEVSLPGSGSASTESSLPESDTASAESSLFGAIHAEGSLSGVASIEGSLLGPAGTDGSSADLANADGALLGVAPAEGSYLPFLAKGALVMAVALTLGLIYLASNQLMRNRSLMPAPRQGGAP